MRIETGVQKAEHHLPLSLEGAGVEGSNGPNESESHDGQFIYFAILSRGTQTHKLHACDMR